MATVFSNTVNYWRAFADYVTSLSSTHFTVTVTAFGVQAQGYGFDISSGITTTIWDTAGGACASASGGMHSSYGGYDYTRHWEGSHSHSYARGHSAYNVSLGVAAVNSSGYMNGSVASSSGSGDVVFTVPALDSYTVSFNANGGTGAPSAQTKWYGETLTLSTVNPTRANYTFKGWATSPTATSATYAAGGSYTSNSAVTLYAVWERNYIQPTVRNLAAVRCASNGTASDSGTYAKVTGSWAVDTSINPSNKATSLKIEYRATDASSWTTATSTNPAASSGSISSVIGGGSISAGSAYYVRVTVADSGGSVSQQAIVPAQFRPMDIGNGGKTVAFGAAASSTEGFEVTMDSRFAGSMNVSGPSCNFSVANAALTKNSTRVLHGGKVLYSNASGTNGTVTLSESAANFSMLEIFYSAGQNDNINKSTRVYSPNGKRVALSAALMIAGGDSYQKGKVVTVSGTSISRYGDWYGDCGVLSASSVSGKDYIYITHVVGYA